MKILRDYNSLTPNTSYLSVLHKAKSDTVNFTKLAVNIVEEKNDRKLLVAAILSEVMISKNSSVLDSEYSDSTRISWKPLFLKICRTRMHSSRMRTARCSGRLSCHTCPTCHTHTPCHTPPCHACPPATHTPCHACPLPHPSAMPPPLVDRQTPVKT